MEISEIIKSEARNFYHNGKWKNIRPIPTAQDLNEGLKRELENHPDENKVIYLKELIILIDVDAQKHLKEDCKKKDNPSECPTHQFYAKSKYYVAQIIESISDEYEPAKSNHRLNNNLSKETLSVIEDLFNGGKYPLTKDSPEEISEIINRLKNLGFLYKVSKYSYALHHENRMYIAKLLELKSWNEFNDWLLTTKDKTPTASNVTNHFQNSSIGQFNQAS